MLITKSIKNLYKITFFFLFVNWVLTKNLSQYFLFISLNFFFAPPKTKQFKTNKKETEKKCLNVAKPDITLCKNK